MLIFRVLILGLFGFYEEKITNCHETESIIEIDESMIEIDESMIEIRRIYLNVELQDGF